MVAAVEGKEEEINCVWKDNKLGLFTATTASSDRRNFFSEPASASCCRVVNNSKNLVLSLRTPTRPLDMLVAMTIKSS